MTDNQKARFKAALEVKRQELLRDIHANAGQMAITGGEHDPIDQVQSMNHRDQAVTMLDSLGRTLSNVDRSLHAVVEGSYGICVECEEEIGIKRLEAIPWASHCIHCQEILERGERTHGPESVSPFEEFAPRIPARPGRYDGPSSSGRAA